MASVTACTTVVRVVSDNVKGMVRALGSGKVCRRALFLFVDSGNSADRKKFVGRLVTSLDGAPCHDCGR